MTEIFFNHNWLTLPPSIDGFVCLAISQVDTQQLQDVSRNNFNLDLTSHCWSFGSINHPSSHRKISIGVMVDLIPKKISEASKKGDTEGLNAERGKNASHLAQGKGKIMEMAATKKTKRTEATELANSR